MIRMFWRCFRSIDASFHRQAAQGLFDPGAQACSGHCGHADQTWTSDVTFGGSIGTRWIAAKHEVADVVELSHDTKRIRLSLGGKSTSLGGIREPGNVKMPCGRVDVKWKLGIGLGCAVEFEASQWANTLWFMHQIQRNACPATFGMASHCLRRLFVIENCGWYVETQVSPSRNKLRPDPDKGKPEIDRKSLVSLRGMIAFHWNYRKFQRDFRWFKQNGTNNRQSFPSKFHSFFCDFDWFCGPVKIKLRGGNLENATGELFFLRYTPVSGNELPGYVDLVAWDLVLISRPSHLMWNLEPFSREGFHPKKT